MHRTVVNGRGFGSPEAAPASDVAPAHPASARQLASPQQEGVMVEGMGIAFLPEERGGVVGLTVLSIVPGGPASRAEAHPDDLHLFQPEAPAGVSSLLQPGAVLSPQPRPACLCLCMRVWAISLTLPLCLLVASIGDVLYTVDGRDVFGMTTTDITALLREPPDTRANLSGTCSRGAMGRGWLSGRRDSSRSRNVGHVCERGG